MSELQKGKVEFDDPTFRPNPEAKSAEVRRWAERHHFQGTPADLRAAFDDAASLLREPAEKPRGMLSKPVYLLICLIEECSEIIQRCCKAIRFGFDEVQPGQGLNNVKRIAGEVNDFIGVAEMLNRNGVLVFYEDPWAVQDKISKVESFMPLSRERGMLEHENV